MKRSLRILALIVLFQCLVHPCMYAATYYVTNTNDTGPGSLRTTVATVPSGSTIMFNRDSIGYGSAIEFSSQIYINKDLTIIGKGGQFVGIAFTSNYQSRLFYIAPNAHVTFTSCYFYQAGFNAGNSGGAGGALYNSGNVTLDNCEFYSNSIRGDSLSVEGGSIYNNGSMLIKSCGIHDIHVSNSNGLAKGGAISNTGLLSVISTSILYCDASSNNTLGGCIYNVGSMNLYEASITTYASGPNVEGGAIYNKGTTEINRSDIWGQGFAGTGTARGGGIYNTSDLKVDSTTFHQSRLIGSMSEGGAIYNKGTAEINHSVMQYGAAEKGAGVFSTQGSLKMLNSVIYNNDGGGAFVTSGTLELINCTITQNNASAPSGVGGAFATSGTLALTNCTITQNNISAPSDSNVRAGGVGVSGGILRISSTIIAENTIDHTTAPDVFTPSASNVQDLGYNLIGVIDSSNLNAPTNIYGTLSNPKDPLLGPLQDNGGNTQTLALLTDSPAIDHGDPNSTLSTDQRGYIRPINNRIDIGAFEYGSYKTPIIAITSPPSGSTFAASSGIFIKTEVTGAGNNPVLLINNYNLSPGYRKLKLGYDSTSIYNRPQNVIAGGNTLLEITLKDISHTIDWTKMQVRPNGSSANPVSLSPYVQQIGVDSVTNDYATIKIPLSAFDPSINLTQLSFIELPYSLSSPSFEMGIMKVIFTGGTQPFLWFGDTKTNNANDGVGGGGQLNATLVPGTGLNGVSKVEFYNGTTKFQTVYGYPFTGVINNAVPGTYSITAKGYYNNGSSSTSLPVEIIVQGESPAITITSPPSGSTFPIGSDILIETEVTGAGTNPVLQVNNYNLTTGYRKLKLGYDSTSIYNRPQNVIAGGNTLLEITLKDISQTIDWTKMQVRPNGSSANPVSLAPYIQQVGNVTNDYATIQIPLSAFDPSIDFTQLSFIELPYSLNSPPFEMGIMQVIFTGGTQPFLWFGDTKTNNANDGVGGGGQLNATLVPGMGLNGVSKVEFYNGSTKFQTVYGYPFTGVINNAASGTYSITAKGYYNDGSSSTSLPVQITVQTIASEVVSTTNVTLYPNPVTDILTIENVPDDAKISLCDAFGTRVFLKAKERTTNISELPSGIYFVTIESEKQHLSKTFKIMKK